MLHQFFQNKIFKPFDSIKYLETLTFALMGSYNYSKCRNFSLENNFCFLTNSTNTEVMSLWLSILLITRVSKRFLSKIDITCMYKVIYI